MHHGRESKTPRTSEQELMNGERRDFSIFKHAIGLVLLLGIGISIVIETLYVVYRGMDYMPYLFVCVAGLILVTFFYGFHGSDL